QRPDDGQLCLDLAQELERRRQQADLLATDELLRPPVRVVGLVEVRQRLAGAGKVRERTLVLGALDDLLEPRLPAPPGRLAVGHGAPLMPPARSGGAGRDRP